jgi:hypothetical protein
VQVIFATQWYFILFLLFSAFGNLIKFTSSARATNRRVLCDVVSHGIKNKLHQVNGAFMF